jgi:hypothetical protein
VYCVSQHRRCVSPRRTTSAFTRRVRPLPHHRARAASGHTISHTRTCNPCPGVLYSSVARALLEPFLEPFFEHRYRIIGRELPGTFVCGPFPSRFSCTRASLPLSPAPFSSIWRIGAGAENSAPNDHAALVSRHLARAEPALRVGFGRIVD